MSSHEEASDQRPLALLLPDQDTHTRLKVQPEGLELLKSIHRPVALISVVGAYRTGKSWLLNELMQIGCGRGFVVGHERHAQTKGVWILPSRNSTSETVRIYVDTEGFEGTGQAEVYDDRIFAFAALVSSVLVYNLAETIKQADIERLAFAATLSSEFWRRAHRGSAAGGTSGSDVGNEWRPPALLWLVQRDFLQGGSVQEYLNEALTPTADATDEHVIRLNSAREALQSFGSVRAMGLVQPHVRRTALCDLPRGAFDPAYLSGTDSVRSFVSEHAHSRRRSGSEAANDDGGGAHVAVKRDERTGVELASLVTRIVDALNAHELPTAGGVVDAFNARLVHLALATLQDGLRALPLPMRPEELTAAHSKLLAAAEATLAAESFGASHPQELATGAQAALAALADANFVASQRACDALWSVCEQSVTASRGSWLPSTARYAARLAACNTTIEGCVGPAAAKFHEQMLPRLASEGAAEYDASYRQNLHRAMIVTTVAGIVVARFCLRSSALELLCILAFVRRRRRRRRRRRFLHTSCAR